MIFNDGERTEKVRSSGGRSFQRQWSSDEYAAADQLLSFDGVQNSV